MYNREKIKPEIIYAIENSSSLEEAKRNFFPEMNIKTFKKLAKEFNVFKPNQSKKGTTYKENYPNLFEIGREKFLCSLEEGKEIQSNKLRLKLFKYNIKERRCEKCNNTLWNGLTIPLEVHHKDGNKFNNKLENLEILCPNCHAQTDTYKSKNKTYKNLLI